MGSLGGEIEVSSVEGKWTKFKFSIKNLINEPQLLNIQWEENEDCNVNIFYEIFLFSVLFY